MTRKQLRQNRALQRLETQLKCGIKTGKLDIYNGLPDEFPLEPQDIKRINKEILILKEKGGKL